METMKQGHTPGPRTYERQDEDDGSIYYAVHGNQYAFIANFENKGDAILDAVAPDLLLALRRILEDPYGCVFCDSGKLRNEHKNHTSLCGYLLAERAIAKAESL